MTPEKLMKFYVLFLSILAIVVSVFAESRTITNFGAASDGKTISTAAIQAAIDSCAKSGGPLHGCRSQQHVPALFWTEAVEDFTV